MIRRERENVNVVTFRKAVDLIKKDDWKVRYLGVVGGKIVANGSNQTRVIDGVQKFCIDNIEPPGTMACIFDRWSPNGHLIFENHNHDSKD